MGGRTCFIDGNLLDGERAARPHMSIVVEGQRIVSVSEGAPLREPGDLIVNCGGRTIMPGMTTGHFHRHT